MFQWRKMWPGLLLALGGCGSADTGDTCVGDTVFSCPCPGDLEGELPCVDGKLGECICPEIIEGKCSSDLECDDGAFCNGREKCDPTNDDADANGCIPAEFEPLCDDGIECTVDTCDDEQNRCVYSPPDEDGDGFGDASCEDEDGISLGDDCDDEDSNRYPGNFEICDDDDVDEDCDPNTFGLRDQDGDGAIDAMCCNGENCGDDCNDLDIAQNPNQPEFCDDVDNDCDGDIDEEATEVPWYIDEDGDGFGTDAFDVIESCIPIAERSLLPTDCNDSVISRHPAQIEICDLADNNCNGLADEGPDCGVPLGYPVLPGSGGIVTPPAGSGGSGNGGTGGSGNGGSGGMGSGGMGSGGMGSGGQTGTGGGSDPGTPIVIECDSRDISTATEHNGTISGLVNWSGVIHLTGNVTVGSSDRLVIAPGTLVVVDPGLSFAVQNGGRLDAFGTEENPIKFCGKEGTPGYWNGFTLNVADAEGALEWTLLADAGGGGANGALSVNTNLAVRNVRVENSGNVGLYATKWGFGSSDLTVTGSVGTAVVLTTSNALTDIPLGGSYLGNGEDKIRFLDSSYSDEAHFRNFGLPYLVKQSVNATGASISTFDAGVVVEMEAETHFHFAWNSGAGSLNINGTAEEPVIFRGRVTLPGFWNRLVFDWNLTAGSSISHLVVQHAGFANPAVELSNALPIDHLTIEDVAGTALYASSNGFDETSNGISIADTDGMSILAHPNALVTLPADTQLANNSTGYIQIEQAQINDSGTIPALAEPYYIDNWMRTGGGSSIHIAPGVEFLMGDDAEFVVGWNSAIATIHMNGTAENPIVFDHILGDSGHFGAVYLGNDVTSDSTFSYVTIRNGGSSGQGALDHRANPAVLAENISNCTFENSLSFGLYNGSADKTQDYSMNGNTFTNNASGDIGP